jgi:hypothetical protein
MKYAAESDHHVRKTVRSLRRTLGLLVVLAVEVTAVYALPPETCDLAANSTVQCDEGATLVAFMPETRVARPRKRAEVLCAAATANSRRTFGHRIERKNDG